MIPRLQAACPVVNLLKRNDRVWIDRVRVCGSLLEKKTTGKGQKRQNDEQGSHRGQSNQPLDGRSRGNSALRACRPDGGMVSFRAPLRVMHLRFTEEELGVLIEMVSLAAEVASLNRRPGAKESFARFEALENTILEKVTHLGFGDIIEFDEVHQRYRVSTDYLTRSFVQEALDEMRNEIFWEELTLRLAERDVIRKIGLPAWNSLDEKTRKEHTGPIEKNYWEEFTKRGIDTLHLIARFETG